MRESEESQACSTPTASFKLSSERMRLAQSPKPKMLMIKQHGFKNVAQKTMLGVLSRFPSF